jgi:tetratricopeptide (TPR) repeat protein
MTRRSLGVLACVAGLALAAALPPADESGFKRFLAQQTEAAKVAQRKKDHDAAAAAWLAVLEMDPASLAALEGLAESARAKGDADAETFWRTELEAALVRAIAAGDKALEKNLAKHAPRLGELDPQHGRADALMAEYSAAQAALGEAYLADAFYANAQLAWQRRLSLCAPGSAEAALAREALARIAKEGGDEVAGRFDAVALAGDKDQAWIEEFDRKTSKWSQAARWETPHYRIKTSAGWRLGTEVAGVMERVNAYYREIWGIVPDPKPDDARAIEGLRDLNITPIDVNIYGEHEEYARRSGAPDWSGGVYTGSEVATYDHGVGGGKNSNATLTTLFHEASHQFMDVAVGSVPSFVNEGVASLFEGIEILSNGTIRRDLPVGHYLSPLADKLKKGTAKPLREIFNAQENKPEQYEYRWGVMYFLRNYVDDQGAYAYRDRLQDYIWEFKKGSPGDMVEHFTKFVIDEVPVQGIETFAQFEAVWKKWIVDLADEQTRSDKRLIEFRKKGLDATGHGEHESALKFYDKALDLDPDDLETLWGVAVSAEALGRADRATAGFRRFVELCSETDARRGEALGKIAKLDPHESDAADARRALAGGMAGLALEYDRAGLPRMALRCAKHVLSVDPFEPGSRALVTRLERDKGLTVDRWRRLFNGFDLEGWYGVEGGGSFHVADGKLVADSARVDGAAGAAGAGGKGGGAGKEGGKGGAGGSGGEGAGGTVEAGESATYQALMVDRKVDGDWSLQARIETEAGWEIVGLCFGAKDSDHYEAVVLRHTGDGVNNVDFGTFAAGNWSFGRTDGSVKAKYDPSKGVLLRIDVRGKSVAVTVDGQSVKGIVNKVSMQAIKYPLAALRGDIGLLASRGVTRFSDVRLLSGGGR